MRLIPSFCVWPPYTGAAVEELEPEDGKRIFVYRLVDIYLTPPPTPPETPEL